MPCVWSEEWGTRALLCAAQNFKTGLEIRFGDCGKQQTDSDELCQHRQVRFFMFTPPNLTIA